MIAPQSQSTPDLCQSSRSRPDTGCKCLRQGLLQAGRCFSPGPAAYHRVRPSARFSARSLAHALAAAGEGWSSIAVLPDPQASSVQPQPLTSSNLIRSSTSPPGTGCRRQRWRRLPIRRQTPSEFVRRQRRKQHRQSWLESRHYPIKGLSAEHRLKPRRETHSLSSTTLAHSVPLHQT
jgi:hypothetical protein